MAMPAKAADFSDGIKTYHLASLLGDETGGRAGQRERGYVGTSSLHSGQIRERQPRDPAPYADDGAIRAHVDVDAVQAGR
jgi:hypothetical protein